jgi:hypothetical protein
VEKIGQAHAKEVLKWQELARYAGDELKHLGLTVTAGVQINQSGEEMSYSIVKVQLNRQSTNTEIDLLSPQFAEKFVCGKDCQRLGLYNSKFTTQETQLTHFFFTEEGRFFEFYGGLTKLNETLAYYRASSPVILNTYLTWMWRQKLVFNSLAEFIDHLKIHITEEKLVAFSKNDFITTVSDRSSPAFLADLAATLSNNWQDDILSAMESRNPKDDWDAKVITPDKLLQNEWLAIIAQDLPTSDAKREGWEQARQNTLQLGSIACTFSDNSLGLVTELEANRATLEMIGQARKIVDGMKLYAQPGYLFNKPRSFYFVKESIRETYLLSDLATCNMEELLHGQG